jgi:arylsulfatase A-like enzyme
VSLACAADVQPPIKARAGAPNIVLILLDDVGFGAASTFGGPAQTPELDKLAAQGLRYNRFHVSALCSPTRAALLSGRNDHKMGFGSIAEEPADFPGYNVQWPKSATSVADILRRNGYSTAAFGKWHNTPTNEISPIGPFDRWPTGLGFEYFYGFMGGWDSPWEPTKLYRDTTPVEPRKTPEEGYHLTSDITEEAISWIQTHESLAPDKPYFLYFAPGATHWPHQVPKEWIEKYRGQFDRGWDKLREETLARQKSLGVVPASAELTPRPKEIPAWDSLSTDQKKLQAREMEVYAAYLAHTDHDVGRLLRVVQRGPQGYNTLILYIVGDNGAIGWERPDAWTQAQLRHLDEIGSKLYPGDIGSGWALAADTPYQWMKAFASHLGGTRDPLIVAWPARIKDRGGLRSQYTHVTDVAPTLLEVAGIRSPAVVDGVKQQRVDGISFVDTFDSRNAPLRHRVQIFEQLGNRSIYQDGWVAAARHMDLASPPSNDFKHDRWELYHLDEDFSEAHDIAAENPEKLRELQNLFEKEAKKNRIYPLRNFDENPKPPALSDNRKDFIYYPGLPRIPAMSAPHFGESPYLITANITIPKGGAQGVILSYGGRMGGFALYAKDGRLVYEANDGDDHHVIRSNVALPTGDMTVACQFTRKVENSGSQLGQVAQDSATTGTVRLFINGQLTGEAPSVREALGFSAIDGGTLGIGEAFGSPVSFAFQPPFKFTGTLEKVTVELK